MIKGKELKMGRHTHFGKCTFRYYPKIKVGNFTSISSFVTFMGRCHHPSVLDYRLVSNYPFYEHGWGEYPYCGGKGKIYIGSDVWIGEHSLIMDNVSIGNGAIVGARAVVTKDVPDYAVVVGNPSRVVKYRFKPEIIASLNRIAWWKWSDDKISDCLKELQDVESFVRRYDV